MEKVQRIAAGTRHVEERRLGVDKTVFKSVEDSRTERLGAFKGC